MIRALALALVWCIAFAIGIAFGMRLVSFWVFLVVNVIGMALAAMIWRSTKRPL